MNDLHLGFQGLSATIFNMLLNVQWLRSWSCSLSVLTRTTHSSFHHFMIFLCANELKLTDNVMWYSEAPEWVWCAITQVISLNGWHKQLDLLYLSCPASSPLTDIWMRASLKLQQAVLWKFNLVRSHCQISGLGCAQSILPWQIALLRYWCPLQPHTYVRVDYWPSLV